MYVDNLKKKDLVIMIVADLLSRKVVNIKRHGQTRYTALEKNHTNNLKQNIGEAVKVMILPC